MPLKWRQQWVSDEIFESAGVFDVNNDGVLDIVSGAFWYQGPDFRKKHFIGPVRAEGEYFDDFSTIALDVNGDGYLDFLTGGWWGNTIRWRENPKGDPKQTWTEHVIAETGNVETTRGWDVDSDGLLEIIPNTPRHVRSRCSNSRPTRMARVSAHSTSTWCMNFQISRGTGSGAAISPVTAGWTFCSTTGGWRRRQIPGRASGSGTRTSNWRANAGRGRER